MRQRDWKRLEQVEEHAAKASEASEENADWDALTDAGRERVEELVLSLEAGDEDETRVREFLLLASVLEHEDKGGIRRVASAIGGYSWELWQAGDFDAHDGFWLGSMCWKLQDANEMSEQEESELRALLYRLDSEHVNWDVVIEAAKGVT